MLAVLHTALAEQRQRGVLALDTLPGDGHARTPHVPLASPVPKALLHPRGAKLTKGCTAIRHNHWFLLRSAGSSWLQAAAHTTAPHGLRNELILTPLF